MIDLDALVALLEHQHQLAACCQPYERWAVLDLAGMVAPGQGECRLPIGVRYQFGESVI
jgi:hypothetical protein